ncbi:MAG: glycoside hydrolase family 57 protein [Synechococcales cyanobacterium]
MSHPLYIAFVWHQHQPLYRSPLASGAHGRYHLPWVRLHGIKDYLDMVLLLERFPKLHQTVNLVPSLLLQIEDYVAGTAYDPYLELLLSPVETMTPEQLGFIVDRFFDSHYPTMVAPYPRYRQLFEQREQQGRNWCLQYWTRQDFSDLLAWHNLAWFDPLFHDDPEIAVWLQQQQGFTLADRQRIYAKQQHILAAIIPQHCRMQQAGQLEITTSPYTHPILPLLISERSARVALPGLPLPKYGFHWEGDVAIQLTKAKENYQRRFHQAPRGLWPSEQSVSPAVLPHMIQQGFQWIISDEAVLGASLGKHLTRREDGSVIEPEILYRPYRLETPEGDINIIFRDHRLSDLIGFTYSTMEPNTAAKDLIAYLEGIRNRLPQDQPWLVTIALDGENCWEYYPQDGRLFLENLYTRFSQHAALKLVTVSEYLQQFPPTLSIPGEQLHSGSWIEANFTTWIGDPVKNRAWELLAQARQVLEKHPKATEASWESLWAAEGSDWFWWFGEGHSSAHDAIFDELFREHLQAIYLSLGEAVPATLHFPLEEHDGMGDHLPQGFIHPTINGRVNDREWNQAGRIEISSRGTMHRTSSIRKLLYGTDHFHFYLRLDFSSVLQRPDQIGLFWFYPNRTGHNSPLPVENLPQQAPFSYLYHHGLWMHLSHEMGMGIPKLTLLEAQAYNAWQPKHHHIQAAVDTCLELAVPWQDLGIQPGQETQWVVLTAESGTFREAIPPQTTIMVRVP